MKSVRAEPIILLCFVTLSGCAVEKSSYSMVGSFVDEQSKHAWLLQEGSHIEIYDLSQSQPTLKDSFEIPSSDYVRKVGDSGQLIGLRNAALNRNLMSQKRPEIWIGTKSMAPQLPEIIGIGDRRISGLFWSDAEELVYLSTTTRNAVGADASDSISEVLSFRIESDSDQLRLKKSSGMFDGLAAKHDSWRKGVKDWYWELGDLVLTEQSEVMLLTANDGSISGGFRAPDGSVTRFADLNNEHGFSGSARSSISSTKQYIVTLLTRPKGDSIFGHSSECLLILRVKMNDSYRISDLKRLAFTSTTLRDYHGDVFFSGADNVSVAISGSVHSFKVDAADGQLELIRVTPTDIDNVIRAYHLRDGVAAIVHYRYEEIGPGEQVAKVTVLPLAGNEQNAIQVGWRDFSNGAAQEKSNESKLID